MVLLKYNPKEYFWIRMSEDCASKLRSPDITRKPYFISDGDIIGYSIVTKDDNLPDDFQTEQDREMRRVLEVADNTKGKRSVKETSFKINLDF